MHDRTEEVGTLASKWQQRMHQAGSWVATRPDTTHAHRMDIPPLPPHIPSPPPPLGKTKKKKKKNKLIKKVQQLNVETQKNKI